MIDSGSMAPRRWLTVREAAAYSRCSTVTIAREARAHRLVGYKLARRREWRFTVEDLDRWLMSGRQPQPY
jgi:excisionase family DNA binding protein